MLYAVAGGWVVNRKQWKTFHAGITATFARYGQPTGLICGNMVGCEKFAAEWAGLNLVPCTVITTVMPVERSRHFLDHNPGALILFASGSPANVVLRDKFAARLLPIVEIQI